MRSPAIWQDFTKNEIASICRAYGPVLDEFLKGTDDGNGQPISGASLLFALSGNESSFGANCHPRYESAYDVGGKYAEPEKLEEFGKDWACSWGPWQIMATNALGFIPQELGSDLDKSITAVLGFIQRRIIRGEKATKLDQIFDAYNSGNWRDARTDPVEEYVKKGINYYFTEVLG